MAPLGFFSDIVPVETKRPMVAHFQEISEQQELDHRSIKCTTAQDLSLKTLDYFIGPVPRLFFDALQLDISFLAEDVEKWPEIASYQNAKKSVGALKVVNINVERGISPIYHFQLFCTITKQEEQNSFHFKWSKAIASSFQTPRKKCLLRLKT